jgi:hypothetical protein
VTGAAVGTGLTVAVAVAVAVGVAVAVTVCVARGVSVAGELEVVWGVPEVVVLPADGVLPELPEEAETLTDPLADTVTDGEKTVGAVGDDDEVHAVSATGASRVSAPQHKTVSLMPNVVSRTFMDPPHAPGRRRLVFPAPGARNRQGTRKRVTGLVATRTAAGRSPKAPAAVKYGRWPTLTCNGLFTIGLLG